MNHSFEPGAPHRWPRAALALVAMHLATAHPPAAAESIQDLAVRPAALLATVSDDVGNRVVVAGTLRSPSVSRWQVEWRGTAIAVSPLPEIRDRFAKWSRWAMGKEVLIEGRLRRDAGEPRVDFWIYEFPREFDEEIVDVPLVTVMELMTDPETYSGRLVRVRGVRIKGNGFLPTESRRGDADWVLHDDCCDLWVSTAAAVPVAKPVAGDERLDVVGKAEIVDGVVHVVAEQVVPAPPEMHARIKLVVTGESGEGFAPVCGKALVRVTILGDVPPVPLVWTLYVESEERSSGAVPFLYEGVPKREHEIIEHVLFDHFRGAFMDNRSSHPDRLLLDDPGNTRLAGAEARRLLYELILSERDTGHVIARDQTRAMVDCLPPLCSPARGCLQ